MCDALINLLDLVWDEMFELRQEEGNGMVREEIE